MSEIWTIGYERGSLNAVIEALEAAKIDLLVDVRELPNSRRAGFSKRMLAASLEERGIGYRHMKALGTPKAGRDANKSGDYSTFETIYAAALEQPAAQLALLELGDLAKAQRACLLCLEHDPAHCHRSEIARRLEGSGATRQTHHLTPAH